MTVSAERAVLAGGCFWGVQDLVRRYPGVIATRVGYTGGEVPNATYRNHGNHAEAIEITFDPQTISYRKLLEFFFQIHDPSTLNRQGNDRGASYRSAIFYTSDEQKRIAEDTIADVDASGLWPGKVVTEVAPAGPFWEAEPEHQDYLEKFPDGYTCHFVRPNWTLPHRSEKAQSGRKWSFRRVTKASDLLVAALENEGVEYIFAIPGEENLDVLESLRRSKIKLVLTRHEQAAGFMAATYGRLTGRAGVCLTTLGPGALNLTTAAAYAHLGAMPMVMLTGQKAIRSSRQARFQIVDIVATMRPLTKMATQIVSAQRIPTLVRDAFRVAQQERPGPVHLELPEDIAADEAEADIIPPHVVELPVAPAAAIERAAAMIMAASRPLVMLGAAASRPYLAEPLSAFVRRCGIPFFNTQMGKGAVNAGSNLYMGTAALSERDWVHEAIDQADLIISIGHDTVEKPPFLMGHDGPQVIHVGATPATVEQVYFPQAEIVGDVGAQPRKPGRSSRRQAPQWSGIARFAGRDPCPPRRAVDGGSVSADAAAHRARCPPGYPAGRHRCPRQRHVQDLVCAQLSHQRRQHPASRQRACDHGGGSSFGDRGGADPPGQTGAGGLRRWRVHDEFAGA